MDSPIESGGEQEEGMAGVMVRPSRQGKPDKKQKRKRQPKFHVILWDSDHHTYHYVKEMLRQLFGHTEEQSFILAKTVDTDGKAVVLTTTKEHAELKRDQILAFGKDDHIKDCSGSMYATIEPEE